MASYNFPNGDNFHVTTRPMSQMLLCAIIQLFTDSRSLASSERQRRKKKKVSLFTFTQKDFVLVTLAISVVRYNFWPLYGCTFVFGTFGAFFHSLLSLSLYFFCYSFCFSPFVCVFVVIVVKHFHLVEVAFKIHWAKMNAKVSVKRGGVKCKS